MSLCLATVTTSGLLVSVDGRGVMHDKDNHVHVVTDSAKKVFKINDNMLIFASGYQDTNVEVVKEIIENDVKSLSNIAKICRGKYQQFKSLDFVKKWEYEVENLNPELIEGSIPICLNVFQFDGSDYMVTRFIPQNNFMPEIMKLKMGQIVLNGVHTDKAANLLKQNRPYVKSLESEINRFTSIYKELEKNHKEVGGNIYHYIMGNGLIEEVTISEQIW